MGSSDRSIPHGIVGSVDSTSDRSIQHWTGQFTVRLVDIPSDRSIHRLREEPAVTCCYLLLLAVWGLTIWVGAGDVSGSLPRGLVPLLHTFFLYGLNNAVAAAPATPGEALRPHRLYPQRANSHTQRANSHPQRANSHPQLANSHPQRANAHPQLANSHPQRANSHPQRANSHPQRANAHPQLANSHPQRANSQAARDRLRVGQSAPRPRTLIHDGSIH
eukprot:171433-Pyramimonas_sp.AAC.1